MAPQDSLTPLGMTLRLSLIVIALAWVAHFNRFEIVRILGFAPEHSITQAIERHLDHRYRWVIKDVNDKQLGSIGLGYRFAESGYRIDNELNINDISDVNAGLALMARNLLSPSGGGNRARQGAMLAMETAFDDLLRLQGIEASGSLLDISGEAKATISEAGLNGSVTIDKFNINRAFAVPDIKPEVFQGIQFVSALPPNLETGDQFSAASFAITPYAPYISRSTIDYVVREEISLPEVSEATLLLVDQIENNEKIAVLTVDSRGVVWRLFHVSTKWTLELSSHWHADQQLFPIRPETTTDEAAE